MKSKFEPHIKSAFFLEKGQTITQLSQAQAQAQAHKLLSKYWWQRIAIGIFIWLVFLDNSCKHLFSSRCPEWLPLNTDWVANADVGYLKKEPHHWKNCTFSCIYSFQIPITTSQFFKIDQDRGLRVYGWEPNREWKVIYVFGCDECAFPLKCGKYGVCQGGQCTCPVASDGSQYFTPHKPKTNQTLAAFTMSSLLHRAVHRHNHNWFTFMVRLTRLTTATMRQLFKV